MYETTRKPPVPPAELWGLWMPLEGCWYNHIHGAHVQHAAPMTFVDRDDAEETARLEMEWDDPELIVARIGVAPPDA